MHVHTACPSCSVKIKITNEMVGKALKCPRCGGRICIPAEESVPSKAAATSPLEDPLRTTDHAPSETPAPDLTVDFAAGAPSDGERTATRTSGPDTEPKGTEPVRVPKTASVPGYEIESVLGRGGMGVVYKARHLTLKRTVALKMVLAGGHAGPGELARFRIEAEAVARLQHSNIVQIHEVGEANGHPYCALEFVEGGNLASKLDGKPLAARNAAKLVEALARAMHLAHSRNVVHRDLKPANILLTADGKYILTGSEDKTAKIWDAQAKRVKSVLMGHTETVVHVRWSPDGKQALTGSEDGTARVWDAETGQAITVLRGHAGKVTRVAFSPDCQRVLTASEDTTAQLWDPETGKD